MRETQVHPLDVLSNERGDITCFTTTCVQGQMYLYVQRSGCQIILTRLRSRDCTEPALTYLLALCPVSADHCV
jgi:hypothetical protein